MRTIRLLFGKVLTNLRLDLALLVMAGLPFGERVAYWVRKYIAILSDSREIRFLGRTFRYDNRLSPALLPDYVSEVLRIAEQVQLSELRSVLDIGANVGQFAYTLKSLFPHLQIYSFEPNPEIFPLLQKNAAQFEGWKCFNFGIGPQNAEVPFYFVRGKSAQGSLYSGNAALGLLAQNPISTKVQIRRLDPNLLVELSIPAKIDFVKVDVEGAELQVFESLANVDWRYLYAELSANRAGSSTQEQALAVLRGSAGKALSVVSESAPAGLTQNYEILILSS